MQCVGGFLSKVGEKLADWCLTRLDFQNTSANYLKKNKELLCKRALDIEEKIKNEELSGRKKRKQGVDHWLTNVQELNREVDELLPCLESEGFIRKFFGGDESIKLRERMDELLRECSYFDDLFLDVCGIPAVPFLPGQLVGEKFAEHFRKIWKFLVVDRVSSIGIYGMGGAGKTTLAKHIHDQLLKESHKFVFWITVSQAFTINNLQGEIARLIGLNLEDEHNEDKRAARLKQVLFQKSDFVLILDDVWKEINLKKLGDPLSVPGGKLIITTRSSEVCYHIGCKNMVPVAKLNESEAWDLYRLTFGEEEMASLATQIQKIGKAMTRKCDGLPLAIKAMAGCMKGKNTDHEWSDAWEELNELLMMSESEDGIKVFEVFKFSFDQLGRGEEKHGGYTMLQQCFLYCCLYPEDFKIYRRELIKEFISEEMLDTKKSRRKQVDKGHAMLTTLVNVCLLESDETMWWVKMHDVVRAMALKITERRYMSIDEQQYNSMEFLKEEYRTEELEKVSMVNIPLHMKNWNKRSFLNIPEWISKCPKLSALLLQRNYCFELIPPDSFSWMPNLHVLNLSFTRIEELPDSLSDLRNLKSLILYQCWNLTCVPNLGKLKELQELDLSCTKIKKLPEGMEKLTNLECLKFTGCKLELLPGNFLPNFQKLVCLHLPLNVEVAAEEIERLMKLEDFIGCVKHIFDFKRLMGRHPYFKEHNRLYHVAVGLYGQVTGYSRTCSRIVKFNGIDLSQEGCANAILLAPDVKELQVVGCTGLRSFLENLRRLNVNIEFLESLDVTNYKGIECVMKQEQSPIEEAELKFFDQNFGAMQLNNISQRVIFSSLKQLSIWNCNKRVDLSVWALQHLETLCVRVCFEIEEIIQVADDDEYENGVGNQPLPIVHLPKLKRLDLFWLPRMKTICEATLVCTSIESIIISNCEGLKKFPIAFGHPHNDLFSPSTLKTIRVQKKWWESLKLEHPSFCSLLQPFISFW